MSCNLINPATGLPMIVDGDGDCDCDRGVDVGGSPYGTDIHAQTDPDTSFSITDEDYGVIDTSVGCYGSDMQNYVDLFFAAEYCWVDHTF